MGLSNNKILNELQKNVLKELFDVTDKFYATGGTILSGFYLSHRYSVDLDFFTKDETAFNNAKIIVTKVYDNLQKEFSIISDTFYFKHFDIIDNPNNDILPLHFSYDVVYQFIEDKNRFDNIIVDTIEEILINKICAVVGRSEIKDLIDLYFLEKENYDIMKYIPYAHEKDGGVEKEVLAYCLNNIKIEFEDRMMVKKVSKEQLIEFRKNLIKKLLTCGTGTPK